MYLDGFSHTDKCIEDGIDRYIWLEKPNYDKFLSLKIVLMTSNSAYPDEMQHSLFSKVPILCVSLFYLILYVPFTIFQLNRDGSSWVEPVIS